MTGTADTCFELHPSSQKTGQLEINDTVNKMVWGPFPSRELADIQLTRLKTLVDLNEAISEIARLERTLWEEITIDNGSDKETRKVASILQKSIDCQLDCLKREQKLREI